MKRISFQLGVALLTFIFGVGAAWSYLLILQPPSTDTAPVSYSDAASIAATPASSDSPSEPVKITLARSYRDRDGFIRAEFEVFNGSGETLYYDGYRDDYNAFWSVRRGSRSTRYPNRVCGNWLVSLNQRRLPPGESVMFQAVVESEAGTMQVGFDFIWRETGMRQTIWSEEIYLPTP